MRTVFRLNKGTEMTPEILYNYIEYAKPELVRREHLFNYYLGQHAIKSRTYSDASKPNNKVVSPYAHYITDFSIGYFVGEPVQYESEDTVKAMIDDVMRYNDDSAVNAEIAKQCSVCGYGYELCFIDKYGEFRYMPVDPCSTFCIYDNSLENEILYGIRLYDEYDVVNKTMLHFIEVYGKFTKTVYQRKSSILEFVSQEPNYLPEVPITEYLNNVEGTGDFELCISLIDAYDSIVSDGVNESAEFADAYLVLTGMMGTEGDDIDLMKEKRVLLVDKDASASWLTKQGDATSTENLKIRLNDEIHKFSAVPDMTDANFASNASGVAMKYKLLGLENITAKKESEFRKGLLRRIEIFSEYKGLVSDAFDWRMVNIIFTRNLPSNMEETADLLSKIGHLLSTETQLSMLPLDIDIQAEVEKKKSEDSSKYDDGFYNSENPFKSNVVM